MKILFKNTTKYNKENCDNFVQFHSNKYGKKELLKMILFGICIIYVLIFNIVYKNWILVIGAMLLGGIIYLYEKNKLEDAKRRVEGWTFDDETQKATLEW